jgi:hypothetical protein
MQALARPAATISLRYPLHWCTGVHPDADAAEADTRAFLRRFGLLATPGAAARFAGIEVGRHAGWPLFGASRSALITVMRFLTLWLFYDDGIEGVGEAAAARAVAAVRGDPGLDLADADPCLRAWWVNARRYRAMGPAFCAELGRRFRDWLDAVHEEAAQIRHLRALGEHPGVDAYLAQRERSIGVYPVLCLLEYACGRPLADVVRAHPALARVERCAAEVVILQNDLVSAAKETRDRQVNLVCSIRQARRCTLARAWSEIEARHDLAVAALRRAAADLRAAFPADLAVRRWLRAVETMCHGFARWHTTARRYAAASGPVCVIEYV